MPKVQLKLETYLLDAGGGEGGGGGGGGDNTPAGGASDRRESDRSIRYADCHMILGPNSCSNLNFIMARAISKGKPVCIHILDKRKWPFYLYVRYRLLEIIELLLFSSVPLTYSLFIVC